MPSFFFNSKNPLQAHLKAAPAEAQIKAFKRACKVQILCKVTNKKGCKAHLQLAQINPKT